MPRADAGSRILEVSRLLGLSAGELYSLMVKAAECGCGLVGLPFTASVAVGGVAVEAAIGVGSLVCREECGIGDWELREPAWYTGVRLSLRRKCVVLGLGDDLLAGLVDPLEARSVEELFASVARGTPGVAVLPEARDVKVSVEPGFCGVVSSANPLHPAGVVGKPRLRGCIEDYAYLVGRDASLLSPVLRLRGRPVIWSVEGLSKGIVTGFAPHRASRELVQAFILGFAHTCLGIEE